MRLAEDNSNYRASSVERRDFRHSGDGPEETAGKPKRKKDTKRWCRGKEGVEHIPEIKKRQGYGGFRSCKMLNVSSERYPSIWSCNHELVCANCGKIIEWTLGDDCPDKPSHDSSVVM